MAVVPALIARRPKAAIRYVRQYEPYRPWHGDRIWQSKDGRYYCRRENVTTGLIIGAALRALAGVSSIAGATDGRDDHRRGG